MTRLFRLSLSLLLAQFCLVHLGLAQTHTVVAGDTLFELASRYGTSVEELERINSLTSATIRVGQVLNVPAGSSSAAPDRGATSQGVISHTVTQGETLASVAQRYGKSEDELRRANPAYADALGDAPLAAGLLLYVAPAEGEVMVLRQGENILSVALKYGLTPSELARVNGVDSPAALTAGQPIFIPGFVESTDITAEPTAEADTPADPEPLIEAAATNAPATNASVTSAPADLREQHLVLQRQAVDRAATLLAGYKPAPLTETFAWPVSGRITSRYGRRNIAVGGNTFHGGLDIGAAMGTPVGAARSGVVSRSGWGGAYGYVIYIDHPDGSQTRYGHLSKLSAAVGASVRQGQTIGYVGSTGASTGAHLHFEIRFDGRSVDPSGYLQ